jgi:predicted DNA-binding protein
MKRTALFLREDQLQKLESLSKKTLAPVAALIRAAVDEYLSKKGVK